jgi:N-acylneuraminate cytidylyltransferase
MKTKDYIVLIPARKNSKRLIGKNKRLLLGKPLIAHSIEYALKFFPENQIWVNTDDLQIKKITDYYNINFYNRKAELAEDETTTNAVVKDFCEYMVSKKFQFKNIITLQPTNPIRSSSLMIESVEKFEKIGGNSLMSVSVLHKKYGSIQDNRYIPINYKIGQRHQDLEDQYFENGQIYISSQNSILKLNNYISEDVIPHITDEIGSNIDIDYESDFNLAEVIMKNKKFL